MTKQEIERKYLFERVKTDCIGGLEQIELMNMKQKSEPIKKLNLKLNEHQPNETTTRTLRLRPYYWTKEQTEKNTIYCI